MEEWLDINDLVDQVQELIELGLFGEGKSLLDQYKDIYTSDWEICFLYSRIYYEQNKPERAVPYLKDALKLDKDNIDCLLCLFYAYAQLNQLKKGEQYLFRAKNEYPDNDLVISAMIWYYTEKNKLREAVACYETSASILDINPEVLRNIAVVYERLGKFEKAQQCFMTSLNLDPDANETRDLLADHYIMRGDAIKSIELYKKYLEISPNNIRAMSRLVVCLSQNDQMEEAEKSALDIIHKYPNSPVGYVDLSYVYLGSDKIKKAIETADKALDISPIEPEALRVRGIAYSELNDVQNAELSFKKALSMAPDNVDLIRDYYHYLRQTGKNKEMEGYVHKVIHQEYPHCMEDFYFLADYFRETGQKLKALHYFIKAYRCMPGENEIIPPLAEILVETGHTSYAVPILKQYIDTMGWNTEMKKLAAHSNLKGKWAKEGFRFLQFYGQKPFEFRRFAFLLYIKKTILFSMFFIGLTSFIILTFILFYKLT